MTTITTCELGHLVRPDGRHVEPGEFYAHEEKLPGGERLPRRGAHASRNPLFELWLKPIARPYDRIIETADKPIGDLTVPEAMDWVFCLGYAGLTGYVIGKAVGNLLEVALGGRARR